MTAEHVTSGNSDLFYNELAPFGDFGAFVELGEYVPFPDDWVVMISDVQGSTRAIQAGRYKDVNMVGAASITAVLNVCGEIEVPFVFGGDGGTVIVPGALRQAAAEALIGLQAMSEATFGLALRVGAIALSDLRARGADIRVRKYELSHGNYLAMLSGAGAGLADSLLKNSPPGSPYLLEAETDIGAPDLEGLSCRWEPLTPQNGRMMTLMIQVVKHDAADESRLLDDILRRIRELLGHALQESAPASVGSMKFKWPPRGLKLEARATAGAKTFFQSYRHALFTSLVQFFCEKFDRQAGPYNAPVYRAELRSNTDFRKYDGILRMVLDVSKIQAERIGQYLQAEQDAGRLVYGVHLARSALMTCLVFNMAQSEHVHFIDGADGGFAMAAIDFKARLGAGS
jgi:hypothetical protein